jgi:hypothetical protein
LASNQQALTTKQKKTLCQAKEDDPEMQHDPIDFVTYAYGFTLLESLQV